MSLQRRVGELERQAGSGKVVVCRLIGDDFQRLTEAEETQRLAKAQAEAGPNGQVVVVRYVDDWRSEVAT